MSAANWEDVKRRRREIDPGADDPERVAAAKSGLNAVIAGHHLAELRKSLGMTQADMGKILGVTQSRVSDIERGRSTTIELETLRAYAAALGGEVEVTVRIGPHTIHVA